MDKIQVEYGIEFSRLKKDLEDIKAALRNAEASGANSAKGIGDSFDKTNQKIIQNARSVNEFKTRIEQLTAARDRSFNTKAIEAFNDKIQQAEKEMKKLIESGNKLPNSINNGKKSLSLLGQGVENVKGQFINLAKAAAGAFAVQQLISFTAEAVKLAATAEGVERAFGKLNKPNLLNELRTATKGTVSDLELMKSAVKANNFQLPLEQLGTLFKFAQQRAQETGESVDYLTESIVLGISRKSIPILDNLGISSTQIQEEFKKTGDFAQAVGNIVQASLQQQGDAIETTADKLAKASAQWENFKKGFGDFAISAWTGLMDGLDAFDIRLRKLFGMEIPGAAKKQADLNATVQTGIEGINAYMFGQKEQAKTTQKQIQNLEGLNQQLQSLKDILNKAEIGSVAFKDAQKEIIKVEQEIAKATGQETDAMKKSRKEREKRIKAERELKDAIKESNQEIADKIANDNTKIIDPKEQEIADKKKADEEYAQWNFENSVKIAKDQQEIEKQAQAKITEDLQKEAERRKEIYAGIEQVGTQAIEGILSLSRATRQRDMEELNAKQSEEQDLLQQQLDNRLISEDVYAQKKKELDAKQAEELKKQKIKQFEAERSEALFKIAIETAVAVAKAVAASPVTFGLPFSAFALTQGAIQAGLVLAQPIPKFAKGVIDLKGPGTATSDSIPAYLSRGESVMTAIETERHKRALQAMRDGVFDSNYISYEEINRRSEAADRSLAKLKSEKQVNDLAKALAITLNGNNNAEDLYYINKQLRANKKVGLEDETIERLGEKLNGKKRRRGY